MSDRRIAALMGVLTLTAMPQPWEAASDRRRPPRTLTPTTKRAKVKAARKAAQKGRKA